MRIYISVDIEGVAGVIEGLQGRRGNPEYEVARRLMTAEANAAVQGAFAGGASEVTVADSHGPMRNIVAEDLDPRVRLITGSPRPLSMAAGLTADHDGLVLVGWHAAAGNPGVLAHTISGAAFARIEVNGVLAGEPTLFGGHAADLGVPLIAVTGDDRLAAEVAAQFPAAARAVVKRALGAQASDSLSPAAARALIGDTVAAAVAAAGSAEVQAPCAPPLDLRIRMLRQVHADAACLLPGISREGGTGIRFWAQSHAEAIGVISALSIMVRGLDG